MANNAGRQGNAAGGGNQGMNEHVEFTVKAEEDLYLEGSENTIRRVTAETNYSCLMLKTQRFSSLFRHYAKYHGLRKDDLEYYFTNPLENEDTPESVQLQRGDTIMVRKRRKLEPPEQAADDSEFFADMKELLDDNEHMDAVFVCYKNGGNDFHSTMSDTNTPDKMTVDSTSGSSKQPSSATPDGTGDMSLDRCVSGEGGADGGSNYETVVIRAHKCVLTARGEYFKALFRKAGFRETEGGKIHVDKCFSPDTVRRVLEFVYCNRIANLRDCTAQELLDLLHVSNRWLLRDLKRLCEYELMKLMDVDNVAKMYCATEEYKAGRLARSCIEYIMENLKDVTSNLSFQEEMKHFPHLLLPILKAAADMMGEPANKKQRTGDNAASPVACDS
jgi:hypothetical protein